jgi:phosphatidylserine decarboxylase
VDIVYVDRASSERKIEKVYGHKALSLLYGNNPIFSCLLLPLLAHCPLFSQFFGYLQKRPSSARKIAPFVEAYDVDTTEFAETTFASFNDFFTRKLKPEVRPIHPDPNVLIMPADGRYLVYPEFDSFAIKGKTFSLECFLCNSALANRYRRGSMAIIRLCPTDYHRFHFPADGVPSAPRLIKGPLYSVNPIALCKRIGILAENKRMITELETEKFGTILYVEIGATSVGSIHQTYVPNHPVRKGDEKGFFEFGASCIVLLFEEGKVQFDADLIANTESGLETLGHLGQSLISRASGRRG